ncbi:Trm112 family protein [Tistrella mobilis]|uniref:Trm112 family protein n=1 Tax=Tistrella mobilis TaxID=171437 RepID=UPI0031F65C85
MSDATPISDTTPVPHASVDPRLLEILVCPLTREPLRYDAAAQELISDAAKLAYPIRDGIPIMLVDEARSLDDAAGA